MDLQPVKVSYGLDSKAWLASADGTQYPETITLDKTAFTAATHYPNGFIPSGLALTENGTTGLYGPAGASDTECSGHLMEAVEIRTGSTATRIGAALLWRGVVNADKLPVTTTARAPHVRYRVGGVAEVEA